MTDDRTRRITNLRIDLELSDESIQLTRIETQLAHIVRQQEHIMSKQDQETAALERINIATTALAAYVNDLRDQAKNGITPAEADAFTVKLDALATSLTAMASDPTDPVPPLPA